MLPIIADAAKGLMEGVIKPVLDKFVLDASQRVEAEQFAAKQIHDISLAQIEVNKTEAANSSLFISGWRPFVGWVCGGSFAYALVGHAALNWLLQFAALFAVKPLPVLPAPDISLAFEMLLAMLGLGGLRTYEKLHGVARQ